MSTFPNVAEVLCEIGGRSGLKPDPTREVGWRPPVQVGASRPCATLLLDTRQIGYAQAKPCVSMMVEPKLDRAS